MDAKRQAMYEARARIIKALAHPARLVIVDDGFSHWPLARDVDVVMLDATDLWGGGALLPAGRMRKSRVSCGFHESVTSVRDSFE